MAVVAFFKSPTVIGKNFIFQNTSGVLIENAPDERVSLICFDSFNIMNEYDFLFFTIIKFTCTQKIYI